MILIPDEEFERIAKEEFGTETLRTRNHDSLDFHEVAVWALRSAMVLAYELGRASIPPAQFAGKTRN